MCGRSHDISLHVQGMTQSQDGASFRYSCFFCSEHCLFSRCKVVILFPCKRLFCVRVLCKELRWVPSWTGASIVVTIRCRVAFKSNAVVRGTKSLSGVLCMCSARVSVVCFQITFSVLLLQHAPWRFVSQSVTVGVCI